MIIIFNFGFLNSPDLDPRKNWPPDIGPLEKPDQIIEEVLNKVEDDAIEVAVSHFTITLRLGDKTTYDVWPGFDVVHYGPFWRSFFVMWPGVLFLIVSGLQGLILTVSLSEFLQSV